MTASPFPLPGAVEVEVLQVVITMRAAGDVDDYDAASVTLIRKAVAAAAAVAESRVIVVVAAGSVEITATVRALHVADGEAVAASLAAKLATAAQATFLLAEAGVVVEAVDAPRTQTARVWVVLPLAAPPPPLASPLTPSPTVSAAAGDAVSASGSLSTAATVGVAAVGLGCVLCTAIACAYWRARQKRAPSLASALVGRRSTRTRILGVGGDISDTTRVSKGLPPESLPSATELGSITELVTHSELVAASTPRESSSVPTDAAPDLTVSISSQSGAAGVGTAALERARRARRGSKGEDAYI